MLPSRVRISTLKTSPSEQLIQNLKHIDSSAQVLQTNPSLKTAVASAGGTVIGFAIEGGGAAHVVSTWKNKNIEDALLKALQ